MPKAKGHTLRVHLSPEEKAQYRAWVDAWIFVLSHTRSREVSTAFLMEVERDLLDEGQRRFLHHNPNA